MRFLCAASGATLKKIIFLDLIFFSGARSAEQDYTCASKDQSCASEEVLLLCLLSCALVLWLSHRAQQQWALLQSMHCFAAAAASYGLLRRKGTLDPASFIFIKKKIIKFTPSILFPLSLSLSLPLPLPLLRGFFS